jgi:5-methyltetrahydropteroyltriglutamate--homocysteine methyltransferase
LLFVSWTCIFNYFLTQVDAVKKSDHHRSTEVSVRLQAQQKKLNLPALPTTTIGSFPQTTDLRRIRREFKAKKISEVDYVQTIKEEYEKVIKLQEELGIDVLVHGEAEVGIYLNLGLLFKLFHFYPPDMT